jgi:hypothetical protein
MTAPSDGKREHSARILGYQDRLASAVTVIPSYWTHAERRAYTAGRDAAERAMGLAAVLAERHGWPHSP